MNAYSMRERMKEVLQATEEELRDILPEMLEELNAVEIEKALDEMPDLALKLLGKLASIEAATLLREAPGCSEKLMDLLWEAVAAGARKSSEMSSVLQTTRDMKVNIEASDSPLRGHFRISKAEISGGSGLLHFKDEDFRFMGPTKVLLNLLTGELPMGFSNLELQTAGHLGFLTLLGPVIGGVSQLIKSNTRG
jgi:hypothetical protein